MTTALPGLVSPEAREALLELLLTDATDALLLFEERNGEYRLSAANLEARATLLSADAEEGHPTVGELFPDDIALGVQLSDVVESQTPSTRDVMSPGEIRPTTRVTLLPLPSLTGKTNFVVLVAQNLEPSYRLLDAEDARAIAEAENRNRKQTMSQVCHELRSPLNSILGFAQLLELDDLDYSQSDAVAQIRASGKHMLELITDVLEAQLHQGSPAPMQLQTLDLARSIDEAIALVAADAKANNISLAAGSARNPNLFVLADERALRQILLNLLSNAVKYSYPDGGEIRVIYGANGEDDVEVLVMDTGVGIAEAFMDRLFTPFDRLGAAGTQIQGTGLGLSVTKDLVEAMGGTIRAQSRLGAGSTFSFSLKRTLPPLDYGFQSQLAG